jgi:hypothetical protein
VKDGGAVVVSGQVDADPIALPPGTYTVVVQSEQEIAIDVVVESGVPAEVQILVP